MLFVCFSGLYHTDYSNNDTDYCHNNTYNAHHCFRHHILYLSLYFPYVSPPIILEGLKCNHLAKGEPLTVQATPIVIVSELLKKLNGLQIIIIRWKRKYKRKNVKRLQRHWIKQKIHIQIDFSSRKCYYFNDGAIMAKIFYREGAERHACSGSTMIKQRSGWENE